MAALPDALQGPTVAERAGRLISCSPTARLFDGVDRSRRGLLGSRDGKSHGADNGGTDHTKRTTDPEDHTLLLAIL